MTRRSFATAAACAAVAATEGDIILEAIYGARLPATLRVKRKLASNYRYFELRAYKGEADLRSVFAHSGMQPHALAPGKFLIPFDCLEQRTRAWDRFNSDPEWTQIRGDLRLLQVTIFARSDGRQPGGRIFEMSL